MQMNFRSAFNGFNREDVIHYIEFLNSKHAAELNQMNSELDFLRTRQSPVLPEPVPAPQPPAGDETVAEQAARIRELFDRCKELEQEVQTLKAENARLISQMDEDKTQQSSYQLRVEEELEAYRRAERTERFARERAENLYRQANGALADATAKVDEAANEVGQVTDRVIAQLAELQNAVSGSKQALREAAATMYTIRPTLE